MPNTSPGMIRYVSIALAGLIGFGTGVLTSELLHGGGGLTGGATTVIGGATSTMTPPIVTASATISASLTASMQDLDTVWGWVNQESYFRPVEQQQLEYGAVAGMLGQLGDSYTRFETPAQATVARAREQGQGYGGIGVSLAFLDNQIVVDTVFQGTPGEIAGLRRGDVITSVDGHTPQSEPATDVAQWILGPVGCPVHLTIVRSKQPPMGLEVNRATIVVPAVETEIRADGIAVMRLRTFSDPQVVPEVEAGIRQARASNVKGLILDLRNNSGGDVGTARGVIARFVSPARGKRYDDIALQRASRAGPPDGKELILRDGTQTDAEFYDEPMAVLINARTASAAEITAAALDDYQRAVLVGKRTYGKVSLQNIHNLNDGSRAWITSGHWLSPAMRDFGPQPTPTPSSCVAPTQTATPVQSDVGIPPDIEIALTADDLAQGQDPQLERAIHYVVTGK